MAATKKTAAAAMATATASDDGNGNGDGNAADVWVFCLNSLMAMVAYVQPLKN